MLRSNRSLLPRLGAMLLVAVLAMAACSESEPTAAEAGATLKTHILKLLDEVSAQNAQVSDPGGKDVPCGEGKARRTFAATAPDSSPERAPRILDDIMISALDRVADYKITDGSGAPIRMTNESTKTIILLESTVNGRYSVRGETQCLNRS